MKVTPGPAGLGPFFLCPVRRVRLAPVVAASWLPLMLDGASAWIPHILLAVCLAAARMPRRA